MASREYDSIEKIRKDSDLAITMVPTGASFESLPIEGASDPSTAHNITSAASPAIPMYITVPGFEKSSQFTRFNDVSGTGQPLTFMMLINPETMNVGKTGNTQYNYTRKGYVTQLWGLNQDTITANGKTAAFWISREGLTNDLRKHTVGFLNFMALVNAYKNNGYRLIDRTQLKNFQDTTRVIDVISGIEITYDGNVSMGHFNNFTLDEDADHPYLLTYNFEFIVSMYGAPPGSGGGVNEVYGHYLKPEDELWAKRYKARLLSDLTIAKWLPEDMFVDPEVNFPDDTLRTSQVPLDDYNDKVAKASPKSPTGLAITSSAYSHQVRQDIHAGNYGINKGEIVAVDIGNLNSDGSQAGYVPIPIGGTVISIGASSIVIRSSSSGNVYTYAHVKSPSSYTVNSTVKQGDRIYYEIDHLHVQSNDISGYELERYIKGQGFGYRNTAPTEKNMT